MSRIDSSIFPDGTDRTTVSMRGSVRAPTVVVVEDAPRWSQSMEELCAFLEVRLVWLPSEGDLAPILRHCRPMAVLANMDGSGQDGCHVMKLVAAHDPDLPIMVITGGDAKIAGAADAVEEIWGLTSVVQRDVPPNPGDLVEFLFRAGRRGRCLGLMPV